MQDKCENCNYNSVLSCIDVVPLFNGLNKEEIAEIEEIATHKNYHKNELIYTPGQFSKSLYIVHQGLIKISRISEEGKEQVIRVLGPGEFMGESSLFSSLPSADYCEALEKTSICLIDGEGLKELMKKQPSITFKMMDEMSRRLELVENLLEGVNLHTVEWRLAQFLLKSRNEKNEVNLNMTRGYLASHIGMSGETLSRKLSLFEELGYITQIGNRKIKILNKRELENID